MNMQNLRRSAALLWLLLSMGVCLLFPIQENAPDYETKLLACSLMTQWEQALLQRKQQLGIPLAEEDRLGSGLIGDDLTGLTTTYGVLEAKRTAADPRMAALAVQLLTEAGIGAGSRIGAGFSGSFPGLDLAILAACQAMDVEIIYIASLGASSYGANQPEMTFPDMVRYLLADGLLHTPPVLVTPGGQDDCGYDMDADLLSQALAQASQTGFAILQEPDFEKNIAARMAAYGQMDCFVGVGGNLTTAGPGEKTVPYGVIPASTLTGASPDDGLLQRYNAAGLPVIHLLNIRGLVTDYGLEYDPQALTAPGTGPLFRTRQYRKAYALTGIAGALLLLLPGRQKKAGQEAWQWDETAIG